MQDILAPDFDDCGTTPSVVEVCKTVLKSLLLFRISPIKLKWSASTFTLKTGTFALKTGTFALKTGTFALKLVLLHLKLVLLHLKLVLLNSQ